MTHFSFAANIYRTQCKNNSLIYKSSRITLFRNSMMYRDPQNMKKYEHGCPIHTIKGARVW